MVERCKKKFNINDNAKGMTAYLGVKLKTV